MLLLVALALLGSALVNGYPLIFQDTGTYIDSGWSALVPHDRPIFYGLFLRHVSLAESLWIVVAVQALFVSYSLLLFVETLVSGKRTLLWFGCAAAVLACTTGISFITCILIPEVFSGIAALCCLVLLFHPKLSTLNKWLVSGLFAISLMVHQANLAVWLCVQALVLLIWLVQRFRGKQLSGLSNKRMVLPAAVLGAVMVLVPTCNALLGSDFRASNGGSAFIVNHFNDIGILQPYLDKACATHDYNICAYRNGPWDNHFLWDAKSPFNQSGAWEPNREDFGQIVSDVCLSPEYWSTLASTGLEYSLLQLGRFSTELPLPHTKGSAPYGQISWHYEHELAAYMASKQQNNEWDLTVHNHVQYWLVALSGIFVLLLLVLPTLRARIPVALRWCMLLVVVCLLVNAALSGNLSIPCDRLQNRVVWLLPLVAFMAIPTLLGNSKAAAGK